jgi:uncharacterized protein YndB with AHSA1/START domain
MENPGEFMNNDHIAKASMLINVHVSRVWDALTKPELIKQYFFNTDVVSDWKVGSPILYRGEWEGKPFEDKGEILKIEPEKQLVSTHWSPLSGLPDSPENYHTVTYDLVPRDDKTEITITQEKNASEQEKVHSEENWKAVLVALKNLLEQ